MSLRQHRIVAISVLSVGVLVLLAWGRSMAIDPDENRTVREKLQGSWVASVVQVGESRKVDRAASSSRIEFDGKAVVFRGMIEGFDGEGTYFIDPSAQPARIDMKLDAGWVLGAYEMKGDTLSLCLNPLAPPEQLGVPARGRPRAIQPGDRRLVYVFRRTTDGS